MVKVIYQERNAICAVSENGWSMYEINLMSNPQLLPNNLNALKRVFRFVNKEQQFLDVSIVCHYPTNVLEEKFNKLCDDFKREFIEKTLSNDASLEIPSSTKDGKILVLPDASGL